MSQYLRIPHIDISETTFLIMFFTHNSADLSHLKGRFPAEVAAVIGMERLCVVVRVGQRYVLHFLKELIPGRD